MNLLHVFDKKLIDLVAAWRLASPKFPLNIMNVRMEVQPVSWSGASAWLIVNQILNQQMCFYKWSHRCASFSHKSPWNAIAKWGKCENFAEWHIENFYMPLAILKESVDYQNIPEKLLLFNGYACMHTCWAIHPGKKVQVLTKWILKTAWCNPLSPSPKVGWL